MLSNSISLVAFGLIPMCLAMPHSVPARVDLDHRLAPNMKPRHFVETISEANVSWSHSCLPWNPEYSSTIRTSGSEASILEILRT